MRAVLLLAAFIVAVPDRPDPMPKEKGKPLLDQFQGEWELTKALRNGQPENQVKVEGTIFIIKGNLIKIREGGMDRSEDANFTLDASKTPAALDIVPVRGGGGKGKDIKVEGIVKIEGDTMILCFPHGGGGSRPTEFVSPPNSNVSLLHFKRLKK